MPKRGIVAAFCKQQVVEAQYEWKVENFFSLSDRNDRYESTDMEFSGRTFLLRLVLYDRRYHKSESWIGLFLLLKNEHSPISIRCTLGLKTVAGNTELWKTDNGVTRNYSNWWGSSNFIKRSELLFRRQEFAPCDALTFTVSLKINVSHPYIDVAVQTSVEDARGQEANEGRKELKNTGTTEVAVQTSVEEARGHEANGGSQALEYTDFVALAQSLKDLYVAGKDCDVTLEVNDKKFRAHKLILGARTPVLAAMFSHSTTEAETGIVRVEDCHPEAFEVFLGFVYSGEADNLTEQNVTNVYYVADKYNLPGLKKECVRYMLSNLNSDSVCHVIALAERHDEELLQEKATEFFVENARDILRTASWRKFLAENLNLANDLIIRGYENSK